MNQPSKEFRLVPRDLNAPTLFLDAGDELDLALSTIVPTSAELVEEIAYYDKTDGSIISLRRDCVTYVSHVLVRGGKALAFKEWAARKLDCWTDQEILLESTRVLSASDIDDIVDTLVVFFISTPPQVELEPAWVELALRFLAHPDADVRDSAVAGAFFGMWRAPQIQTRVSEMVLGDPSEAVRSRATVLQEAWVEADN